MSSSACMKNETQGCEGGNGRSQVTDLFSVILGKRPYVGKCAAGHLGATREEPTGQVRERL